MKAQNQKYLVQLIEFARQVSGKHLFFIGFIAISAFFAFLMVMSYRRSVRRNFRNPSAPLPRAKPLLINQRALGPGNKEKRPGG